MYFSRSVVDLFDDGLEFLFANGREVCSFRKVVSNSENWNYLTGIISTGAAYSVSTLEYWVRVSLFVSSR